MRVIRVRASGLLIPFTRQSYIHSLPSLVQRLMRTAYSADVVMLGKYGVASAIISLHALINNAYEPQCCNKDSMPHIKVASKISK